MDRRDFLRMAGLAAMAPLALRQTRARADEKNESIVPTADSVILLWMGGGMAQTETFDPKKYVPFEKGLEVKRVLSTFPSIDTAVDGIKFCQGLENMAKVMDRGTLIRSFNTGKHDVTQKDSGQVLNNLNHLPCQHAWLSGYMPPQTVATPQMGAIVAKLRGSENPDLPAYIDLSRSEKGGKANLASQTFSSYGFLGTEFAPLCIPDPQRASEIISARLEKQRFEMRQKSYEAMLAASPVAQLQADSQKESIVRSMENAYRLLKSPSVKAFDVNEEPKDVFNAYNTGAFGLGCLLARRLVEARARFVQVNVDFNNAEGWDTHSDGHPGVAKMKKTIDAPVAQLIKELDERGLLKRTLVILATEFGRATYGSGTEGQPKNIDSTKHYGMHGHFGDASSCLLYGADVKRGFVYGKTNDEFPCKTTENPVYIHDLHATIYRTMGISPKQSFEVEKRPFYVTRDGIGKAIKEVFV